MHNVMTGSSRKKLGRAPRNDLTRFTDDQAGNSPAALARLEIKKLGVSKDERAARWVQVEALCLCAALERQLGAATQERLLSLEAPAVVKLAAMRLLRRRELWSGFAGGQRTAEPPAAELVSILRPARKI